MTSIRTPLMGAALALMLAGTALAHPASMSGGDMAAGRHEHMREHMREHSTERHGRHLGELKSRLKLDPSQDAAWNSFVQAMQPPVQQPARPDRVAIEKLSTPERIDQMQAWHSQRDAEMKKRGDATKTFYASLSAEQKKTFDAETARHMQRHGHRQHH